MGSLIEINDTLKISKERGFPRDLVIDKHMKFPEQSRGVLGLEFTFWNPDERLYHRPPARVFLVEEIEGKWLYWGNALVLSQTIEEGKTSGRYKITKIYDPEFQKRMSAEESPVGKNYFGEASSSFVH